MGNTNGLPRVRTLGFGIAMTLALAACSGSTDESTSSDDGGDSGTELSAERGVATDSADLDSSAASSGSSDNKALPAVFEDRDIAYTAHVSLEAEDPAEAQNRAVALADEVGGIVFSQDATYDASPSVNMTFKVLPAQLDAFIDGLAEFGEIKQNNKSAEDVTEQVVDLESRIANAAKSVERTRSYLDKATDVVQLAALEGELTRRETDLEILVGQQRQLASRTDTATVTLNISEEIELVDNEDGEIAGFGAAFADGADALKTVGKVLAAISGYLLPFLVVIGLVALPVRLVRKRT